MRLIHRISNEDNKNILIPDYILNSFYYFNGLSEECNRQMRMKSEKKALILLGKYKLKKIEFKKDNYFSEIIFYNDNKKIILSGNFAMVNSNILYDRKIRILCKVVGT